MEISKIYKILVPKEIVMTTIADKLENFGFTSSSYQNNKNGSRISAYRERPLQEGLYSGWKTFASAPIVREVSWNEILRKNQKIKISSIFKTLKPLVLNNSYIKTYIANIFLKASPQFNHSNILEFQNILATISDDEIRPSTSGDVYSFDFESVYRILKIDFNIAYMIICKDIDFEFLNSEIFDNDRMIILSTSLLTFIDLIELIETDDELQINFEKNEIFLNQWIKSIKPNVKISESYENKKIHALKDISIKKKIVSKKISIAKDSELINEFKKGNRNKSLIIPLMGVLTKKNIEVKGEGAKYIVSWNQGTIKRNLNKSEAISYIEKKIIRNSNLNQKNK
jgi:hypothetical protein